MPFSAIVDLSFDGQKQLTYRQLTASATAPSYALQSWIHVIFQASR